MVQDANVNYQNPKDGKMPMLLGLLSGVAGTGAFGAGLVGKVLEGASSIGVTASSNGAYFVRENAEGLVNGGIAAILGGIALYGFGRMQHWYSNKIYK